MLNLPTGTILGILEYIDIFEYFDIPRLFSCQDKIGTKFFVLSTYDEIDEYEWLYLGISNNRLTSLLRKKITLREAYLKPENNHLFKVVSNFSGESKIEKVLPKKISDDDLPIADVFLEYQEKPKVGFGVINAKQAALASHRETYNIHLYPKGTHLTEIAIRNFSLIMLSFQELIDSIGQYCKGNVTSKGMIPRNVLSETEMKLTQIFDGSFGLQLESEKNNDLFDDSLISDALLELNMLIEAGDNEDKLNHNLHYLKGRVANKYRSFLKELTILDSPLKVEWGSPNKDRGGNNYLSKETLLKTYQIISKIDTDMSEKMEFKAELLGLDVKTKRYRVLNLKEKRD